MTDFKIDVKECAICGEPAIYDHGKSGVAFLDTCARHREYEGHFQLGILKFRLGLAEKPELSCAFCEKKLTEKEFLDVETKEFSVACERHRVFAGAFQIDTIKTILADHPEITTREEVEEIMCGRNPKLTKK